MRRLTIAAIALLLALAMLALSLAAAAQIPAVVSKLPRGALPALTVAWNTIAVYFIIVVAHRHKRQRDQAG